MSNLFCFSRILEDFKLIYDVNVQVFEGTIHKLYRFKRHEYVTTIKFVWGCPAVTALKSLEEIQNRKRKGKIEKELKKSK